MPDVVHVEAREKFGFRGHHPRQCCHDGSDAAESYCDRGYCRSAWSAGGRVILCESVHQDSRGKSRVPKHVQPSGAIQSISNDTWGSVSVRKSERLQECERSAENVSTCECEKCPLGLDRKLSKQQGCRDKLGQGQRGLQYWNETIDLAQLDPGERRDGRCKDDEQDGDTHRPGLLARGCGHVRDDQWEFLLIIVGGLGGCVGRSLARSRNARPRCCRTAAKSHELALAHSASGTTRQHLTRPRAR